jgi:multicomponent Na+:H+ antiporter subunit E
MNHFLLNLMLALVWTAVMASFTATTFIVGFIWGYVVLALVQPLVGSRRYVTRVWHVIKLMLVFLWELFISSLRVAWEVITPGWTMKPGIIRIPLDVKTDAEITMLANLISLTPGTLTLDVSPDHSELYVHAMYLDPADVESVARNTKRTFERLVLNAIKGFEPRSQGADASSH